MELNKLIVALKEKTGFPIFITRQEWLEDKKDGVVMINSYDDKLVVLDTKLKEHEVTIASIVSIDWVSANKVALTEDEMDMQKRKAFITASMNESMTTINNIMAKTQNEILKLKNKDGSNDGRTTEEE